ncbi:MAG TPA: ABC transporter permease [Dehalococcoidia bacterium]|nr:ABC transporter permease [Dehalococcoidia bacterium]
MIDATYAPGSPASAEEAARAPASPFLRALRRLLRKRIAVICLALIALFYCAGIIAPLAAPYGYAEQNLDASFEGPSWAHPLGTDRNGRDVLSRNMFAMRTTVVVTIATVAAGGIVLPVTLGLLAGYAGGAVDWVINRAGEILASLPGLPMLVLISATMRPRFNGWVGDVEDWVGWHGLTSSGFADYFLIFSVLSLFGWVGGMRLIRAQVLTLRGSQYVLAAEAAGASTPRILFRHLLPNVLPLVVVGVSASLGAVAGSEIGLTFLGVGIQPPHPSFGALISDGASRIVLQNHPALLLVPAAIVSSLIFAFNLLGDSITDIITPGAR